MNGASANQHPLFGWLQKTQAYSRHKPGEPKVKTHCDDRLHRLLAAPGLCALPDPHHDEIPKPLLKRLRDPVNFMPAYHEAIVGAALAVAGMETSCAETTCGSTPTPEFRAKSKASGKTYEVEVKRKNGWKAPTGDVMSTEFQLELEGYVRDQIYNASKKTLTNPVYWLS